MASVKHVIRNYYRDSVSLMQFSATLTAFPAVKEASAVMATENNINLMCEVGLLSGGVDAGPNDLLIVLEGEDKNALKSALESAIEELKQPSAITDIGGGVSKVVPSSIQMALDDMPNANLALISTPGEYAAAEALKALHLGLHTMIFSDNVLLEDEITLKQYARDHGLLVMGPDCGTAIINGIPLGFANVVQRGDIGIVAASGTGLQQVSSLVDRWNGGISQAIGVGSHDLHSLIGGISMLQGIDALAADPTTKVIVLISKPPSPEVSDLIIDRASKSGKPIVVDFIGTDYATVKNEIFYEAHTLEDAAAVAIALSKGQDPLQSSQLLLEDINEMANSVKPKFKPEQKYIRGLFSGGTFCFETLILLEESLVPVYSNLPIESEYQLLDVWKSQKHTAIDMGDDLFTKGRPHPMIDFRLRNERIIQEAADPEVAVILLDIVLGYGSNMNPANELIPTIYQAMGISAKRGSDITFIASVCGTKGDPQNMMEQEAGLRKAGMLLTNSNASAARLAAAILLKK